MKALSIGELGGGSIWTDRYYGGSKHLSASYHHHPRASLSSSSSNSSLGSSSSYSDDYSSTSSSSNSSISSGRRSSSSRPCRTLFGPTDPSENRRMMREEIHSRREGDTSRWNFDFAREKALNGRFDWQSTGGGGKGDSNNSKQMKNKNTGFQSIWATSTSKSPKKSYS